MGYRTRSSHIFAEKRLNTKKKYAVGGNLFPENCLFQSVVLPLNYTNSHDELYANHSSVILFVSTNFFFISSSGMQQGKPEVLLSCNFI